VVIGAVSQTTAEGVFDTMDSKFYEMYAQGVPHADGRVDFNVKRVSGM